MIGLTPKSSFLPWLWQPYVGTGKVSEATEKNSLRALRTSVLCHFPRSIGGRKRKIDEASPEDDVRVTRSSAPEVEDWVVDTDAAHP